MNRITCIAIDDEPIALGIVVSHIKKIPYLELLAEFDNPIDAIHSAIDLGNPVNPIDIVKKAPPAKIKAIMHDVFVAPIKLAKNVFIVSDPCNAANINPPITPKDAASVGVVQPIYIEPITKIIKENIGIKNLELLILSINLICESFGGILLLLMVDQTAT